MRGIVVMLPFPLILIGGIQLFRMRKSALGWLVAAAILRVPTLTWSPHQLSSWLPSLIYAALVVYVLVLYQRKALD